MKVIDLSHPFRIDDMVFPGTESMSFRSTQTIDKDQYNLGLATINTHANTHTDAPYHYIKSGKTLGEVDINRYVGEAVVVDCRNRKENEVIGPDDMKPYEDQIKAAKRVLICTDWYKRFNTKEYFTDYQRISLECAEYLSSLGILLIGVEAPTLNSEIHVAIHKQFLENNIAVIEGLTNLDQLLNRKFTFCSAPIAFIGVDGFPVRAYAILN